MGAPGREAEHAVTNTISTQYLRAAPAHTWVRVLGRLSRRARTLAFVSVTAHLETDGLPLGDLLAQSQLTKSIVAR